MPNDIAKRGVTTGANTEETLAFRRSNQFSPMGTAFVLYMPIEAYRTAKAREMGLQPPDPFGLNNLNLFGSANQPAAAAGAVAGAPLEGQPVEEEYSGGSRIPVGAFVLIGLGVIFLLEQFGWFHFDWFGRFWPIILIAIGIRILMKRTGRGW